jgi:glycosyltransferase involved in cell wall biosynthesis
VQAFERLKTKYPLELTVVSNLIEANYVIPTTPGAAHLWKGRMQENGIRLLQDLSFSEVRRLLAKTDFLLLPTLDDSFGYSVVEAMAAGAVPLATRIRALPEIITQNKDGVLLDVNVTPEGRLIPTRETWEELTDKLVAALVSLIERPAEIGRMAKNARRTFEQRFTVERLSSDLEKIYERGYALTDGSVGST